MITCDFTGNLGNHMWQYAITRAVAQKNGYEFGFNPITSHDYYGGKPQMDFLNVDYGKIHHAPWGVLPDGVDKTWEEIHNDFPEHSFCDYQPDVFDVEDGTKLVIGCCQDARYLQNIKGDVAEWFSIKNKSISFQPEIVLDENTCVINVRGGEYKQIPNVLLAKKYWEDAIGVMLDRNSSMKFVVISDDRNYAQSLFYYPVYHFSIEIDYYIVNNAKNLILSNSSFGIFPTWLNKNDPFVIAPHAWARHNVSNGYWANSAIWTFGWNFLNRNGDIIVVGGNS